MSKPAYRTKVIVIGAGVSGLACARELSHRGYQVLVVEARSRAGGRLKGGIGHLAKDSKDGGGLRTLGDCEKGKSKLSTTSTFVDLGGALIHGIDGNPVYAITEEMGIPTKPISDCLLFDASGWPVDFREDEKVSAIFNECLEETFARISKGETPRELRRSRNFSLSFGTIFDTVCEEKGAPHNHPLFKWYQANLEVSCGASFPDLGYQWNEDEPYGFDGDHVAVETSWNNVVEGLAEGLEILYRCPVKRVRLVVPKETSLSDQEKSHGPSDDVNSSNDEAGSSRKRKRQIASVRNLHDTSVHPARRSRRLLGQDAHTRRSSRANKGIMVNKFEIIDFAAESYDADSVRAPRRSHSRSQRNEKTVVQVTLENGKVLEGDAVVCTLPLGILKVPEGSTGHIQFDPPLSLPKQEAIRRLGCGLLNKCVLSFPHVFWQDSDFLGLAHKLNSYLVLNAATYMNKPVLIFMYGGAFAKEVESWTDIEIVQDCIEVLKLVCSKEVPTLLDYQVTRWGHERFSRMSFSYVPPGVDGARELQTLSEPICDPHVPTRPVLMFAGEHTTQFHPSTIHGAFMTGVREAYRLDLIMDPEGNNNLEFKEDELYEHTFRVRRQMGETTENSVTTSPKEEAKQKEPRNLALKKQKQQHRRRGAAFVMTLRNRPKETENLRKPVPSKQIVSESPIKGSLVPHGSPARRSQRSLKRQQMDETRAESDEQKTSQKLREKVSKEHLSALETRSLLRAIESYGENYDYIQSHVLPVFAEGAGECTVGETRARCKQLLRSTAGTNSKPFRIWKYWESKKAVLPVDVEPVQSARSLPARNVPSNGKRTSASGRKQKFRSKSVSPVTTSVQRNNREKKLQVVEASVLEEESKQTVNESTNPMNTRAATRASPRVSKPRNRLDL